jgi:DNA-binding Lrp family transcriptional regulator
MARPGRDGGYYNASLGRPCRSRSHEGSVSLVKAYVLIVTAPEATHRVAVQVRAIRHVSEVYEVMGPYDIVAEIETESLADVPGILADQIRTLDGIQSTTSLVAFPDRTEA